MQITTRPFVPKNLRLLLSTMFLVSACSSAQDDSTAAADIGIGSDIGSEADASLDDVPGDVGTTGVAGPDPTLFADGAIEGAVTIEPCTLSGGTKTTCYSFTISGAPADYDIGPFCPRSITDGAESGGLWIEEGKTWDLSGEFIANLATFYNDDEWLLYDPATGLVNVTDTKESCDGAARPDVAVEYQNHCVECELSYMDTPYTKTVLIPVTPVLRSTASEIDRMGKIGISLSGTVYDAPAPTDAILAAHTIAAFDDCGGHINLNEGYHVHAATGCTKEVIQADGHAPLIGYARDGFGMHAMLNEDNTESDDLDACRGHQDATRGYHYHVASAGENQFIGCFMGETGEVR